MTVLILHNLRSAHNVGAIFRTADAVGVGKIYLTGFTPAPVDRFGRPNKEIAKTALGAEAVIPWEAYSEVGELLDELEGRGYQVVALEQAPGAVDYKSVRLAGPTAVVVGSEVGGLPGEVLERSRVVAEIPMRGSKESLNVATACGIFLYRLLDR